MDSETKAFLMLVGLLTISLIIGFSVGELRLP